MRGLSIFSQPVLGGCGRQFAKDVTVLLTNHSVGVSNFFSFLPFTVARAA